MSLTDEFSQGFPHYFHQSSAPMYYWKCNNWTTRNRAGLGTRLGSHHHQSFKHYSCTTYSLHVGLKLLNSHKCISPQSWADLWIKPDPHVHKLSMAGSSHAILAQAETLPPSPCSIFSAGTKRKFPGHWQKWHLKSKVGCHMCLWQLKG